MSCVEYPGNPTKEDQKLIFAGRLCNVAEETLQERLKGRDTSYAHTFHLIVRGASKLRMKRALSSSDAELPPASAPTMTTRSFSTPVGRNTTAVHRNTPATPSSVHRSTPVPASPSPSVPPFVRPASLAPSSVGRSSPARAFFQTHPQMMVSGVKCHLSTILTIILRQFEDRCHNSMHEYVNIVSKSVYYGSNVLFLGVLSNHVVTDAQHERGDG